MPPNSSTCVISSAMRGPEQYKHQLLLIEGQE
uniref:Uncharacterized protein n=1 Tax=Rhizophora mucronata TaxID=61149 RepID=A0A2P2MYS1_RHIMU